MRALFGLLALFVASKSVAVDLRRATEEIEHLLVDTGGANDGGFKRAITPCNNYVSGSQLLGRETAAQWIRVAFHDFVTANVTSGTGGIDASIGFETLRPENSGSAMNDSLSFFAPYVNKHVSMADLIALSVVMSIGACSGPHIPLRVGRIDATQGGAFGVPEPETEVEETLGQFLSAGFDKSDSIALTACGHTMGSVHNGGFPQVVPPSAITPNNTGGGIHFDATPADFDINVVQEYLSSTGQRGGPLVTTDNVTVRSDLRLYLSDSNETMQTLSQSSTYFITKCNSLFARMINTVPREVNLSEAIQPLTFKPVNVTLSLDCSGRLRFSGSIRYLNSSFDTPQSDLPITYIARQAGSISQTFATFASDPANIGSSIFGSTYYYRFSTEIDSSKGISGFTINGEQYPLNDAIFWLPDLSLVEAGLSKLNITAAVLASSRFSAVEATLSIPSPQPGTLSPHIETRTIPLSIIGTAGLYTIYSALTEVDEATVYRSSVDIVAHAQSGDIQVDEFRKIAVLLE